MSFFPNPPFHRCQLAELTDGYPATRHIFGSTSLALVSPLIYWDPTKHAAPLALPSFKVLGHLVKITFLGKTLQSILGLDG